MHVARRRRLLSTAEFEVLSVCHSVEWTDPHTTDEALHPHRRHAATTDFRRGVSNALDDGGHGQRRPRGRLYRRVFAEKEKFVMMGFGERRNGQGIARHGAEDEEEVDLAGALGVT